MGNPARRLLEIYSGWQAQYGPTREAGDVREINQNSEGWYKTHLEVARLLIEIDYALSYLESQGIDVGIYQAEKLWWMRMFLNWPASWTGASSPDVFPAAPLQHLQTLATFLDISRPSLAAAPEATLRSVLARVTDLLRSDETISDRLRLYIHRLSTEIQTALDDESVAGEFDFAVAAERLWVSLHAAAGQSQKRKADWKKTAQDIIRDTGVAVLGSAPALGLSLAQLLEASK